MVKNIEFKIKLFVNSVQLKINARNVHFRCNGVSRHIHVAEILKCDSDCGSYLEYTQFSPAPYTSDTLVRSWL
jgi:hypothetical protein